jgi:poly(A)-specific ribonuclease
MDFNKWINKGIPYINAKHEKKELDYIIESNINNYDPLNINKVKTINIYKEEDKEKYEEFCKLFTEFLNSDNEKYLFEKCPKFMQYHILNNLQENIRKNLYFSEERMNDKNFFVIQKVIEAEKIEKIKNKIEEKNKELIKTKGFRNIFEAIVKYKKIIIGHNCILDINFIISHFGDNLPNSYSDWKKLILSYFEK